MTVESNPRGAGAADVVREGESRIVGRTIPIIFVPGIMGTRIHIEATDSTWDPDSPMTVMIPWAMRSAANKGHRLDFGNPAEILTDPADDFDNNHDDRVAKGWGSLSWGSYGPFMEFLERLRVGAHRLPVYAVGYDWRQPILQLGCFLAAEITGQTTSIGSMSVAPSGRWEGGILARENATQCIIITHSMGGLVTRTALSASAGLRDKTIGVMHGVQPATGGVPLYRRLITGAYARVDGGYGVADIAFRSILGGTGEEVALLASRLPGAMQLLPSNIYRDQCRAAGCWFVSWTSFDEAGSPNHGLQSPTSVYDMYVSAPTAQPPGFIRTSYSAGLQTSLRTRVGGVRRFHEFLGDYKYTPKTWAFYGTEVNTDSTVHMNLPPSSIRTVVIPTYGEGPPVIMHEATRPDGTTAYIDIERDVQRNGHTTAAPRENSTAPSGWGAHGDGTVARLSGSALFTPAETLVVGASAPAAGYRFSTYRQFSYDHVEHEPAFQSPRVQTLCSAWITYVIGLSGP